MKKRLLATLLALVLVLSTFGLMACGNDSAEQPADPPADTTADPVVEDDEEEDVEPVDVGDRLTINLWSFTDEVPNMVARYKELNPDFAARYYVHVTVISTTDGAYQPALDQALVAGGDAAPDIFTAEAAFVLKYTQGDMASFAMPYAELGIDVDSLIASSEIAPYTVEIGTRPSDNQVVGLGFQATGGALIYRRSIAQEVFGTDDPDEVRTHVGPGWNQFMTAAAQMRDAGYAMVSGGGDLWQVIRNTGNNPWIVDGYLYIDPLRLEFMELHRTLYEEGFMNDTTAWSDAWFADMSGTGEREAFCFLGPAWLINYVMAGNAGDTYGDWAVTVPPAGFFWGGTWVIANAQGNPEVRGGVAALIEWITLDASDDGLQYHWANGTLFADNPTKDAVGSGAVMARSNGEVAFLGGQDMFDVFVPAGEYADGSVLTQYDETINNFFMDQSTEFATGQKTLEEAIRDFKQMVADNLAVRVNFD